MIVLLAGTSGTGKSSLALLIAKKMGITTVFSTDTVRHIMRNTTTPDENPILFASTYEAGKFIKEDHEQSVKLDKLEETPEDSENLQKKLEWKNCLKGYKNQCSLVEDTLMKIIELYVQKG